MKHEHQHAFRDFNARRPEGLVFFNRRNMLKASLAGISGLSFPALLRSQARAAASGRTAIDLSAIAGNRLPSQRDPVY